MTQATDKQLSPRVKLLLILAIAIGPIVFAYVFYFYFRDLAPGETTNEGHLIQPPRQVEEIAAGPGEEIPLGHWGMLIITGSHCDTDCERLLYLSRQVRRGLGKDTDRVKRFVLVGARDVSEPFYELLDVEHPEAQVRYFAPAALHSVFGDIVEAPIEGNYIFLMDPNGNIMMYYTSDLAGKPMLKDLKHLLKISAIG